MANKLLKGSFLLSSASLISKILGFVYIIPFTNLVGASGYALYKYAYSPYTIMISLSTMGIPLAISKMVSKYNQQGQTAIVQRIFKYGITAMILSGFIAFMILYNLAPFLATLVANEKSDGNSIESVTYVIKAVSFALLIIPPMSFLRGFFQGHHAMAPTALSTVLEQLTRVLFILIGVFIAVQFFQVSITKAVGLGTFGAFIGAIFGIAILLFGVYIKKDFFFRPAVPPTEDFSMVALFKEMITHSIPFVVMGLSLPLYQTIDTFSINQILMNLDFTQLEAETVNSVIGLAQILVLIPVSITTGLSVSIIPTITKSYLQNDLALVRSQLNTAYLTLSLLILPAALGVFVLAEPLYIVLFGDNNFPVLGGHILKIYAPVAILIALYSVTSSILQAINQQKKLIIGLVIGLSLKTILNFILPHMFLEEGFIIATYCGYIASLIFNIYLIHKFIGFEFGKVTFRLISCLVSALFMTIIVLIIQSLISSHVPSLVTVIICALLGILIYATSLYGFNFIRIKKFLDRSDQHHL